MSDVKLVAESIQEWEKQTINESAKGNLARFIKDPSNKKHLLAAYARQIGKTKGLKNILLKMDDEKLLTFAKQSYVKMQKDPKLGYPWLNLGKSSVLGGGAMGVASKSGIHKEGGID